MTVMASWSRARARASAESAGTTGGRPGVTRLKRATYL